jgi:hypothetical protein
VFVFTISEKFANLLLSGERITERVQVWCFGIVETSEIFADSGNSTTMIISAIKMVVSKEGRKLQMDRVKGNASKVRVQGVNE